MKQQVAIVTGGGSGIGRATCLLLASEGYQVVVSDVNTDLAESVVNEISQAGGGAMMIKANVAKYDEMETLVAKTVEHYGSLDLMVNNAGIGNKQLAKTEYHTLEDWDNVIAVNQTGVFYGMKLALMQMSKQGSGNIVNVASLAGLKAQGKSLAYSASKFAVVGMTKSAALEYAAKNIRINCVCPSYTETRLLDHLTDLGPDVEQKLLRYMPMKRFGNADEIAQAILWLATDKSSFVTGHALTLGGGSDL